ncbi:MAG: class I SAM-dependent methyltransferase [Bacteroidota bacterium]
MDELLGELEGQKVLDLGCGDGKYGIALLKRGIESYHGIEGSKRMADLAVENLAHTNSTIEIGDIEELQFGATKYDIVVSRLVLHYVEDLATLMKKVNVCLKEQGVFVFSVEHPVITSSYEAYHQKAKRGNWIVDDYFNSGERVNVWLGKEVIKFHRTLEEYWRIIRDSNFEVIEIRESKPEKSKFTNIEEYERRNRIPLFLFFKLRKKQVHNKLALKS